MSNIIPFPGKTQNKTAMFYQAFKMLAEKYGLASGQDPMLALFAIHLAMKETADANHLELYDESGKKPSMIFAFKTYTQAEWASELAKKL